jgi:hypothetical protein
LTLETHRLAVANSRLAWDLSYTLSKAIDEESNERSTSTSFLYDPFNPSLSEGPSDNDVRHRVVGDATYRSPWWGLNVSAIYTWRTGVPYNPGNAFSSTGVAGSPTSLSGLSQTSGNIPIFLDSAGSIIDLTQANNFTQLQLADFLNARGAHIIGRNAYNQPHFHNVDMRISKTIDLAHNTRLQFLIEMFNLLNTRNTLVSSANQDMFKVTQTTKYAITSQPNFGKDDSYSSASDPRQFQVAAKIFF